MGLSYEELEKLADHLLREEYEDKRKNKSRKIAYPILSPSQEKRRTSMEIPYSNLSKRQRLECKLKNLEYEPTESE